MEKGFIRSLICLLALCVALASASKNERLSPVRGSLVVDASGKYQGSFTNISAAVTALHNETTPQTIFIFPGTYTEQVYIPPHAGPLTLQGYTKDARSYKDNKVTITGNLSRQTPGLANNDATATVRLWTPNVKLYNLDIANTFGYAATSGQALALSAQKTNQGFYGCRFSGYQDTVYANEGRQIYAKSYINGAVDFVFGLRAAAWFEKVDIEVIGPGFITANGRDAANNTSFYVFNQVRVTGSSANSTFLGRPWRPYSRVVFQRSYLGDVVRPEGWSRWDAVQSLENVYYKEYKNYGPGAAVGARANFSSQLSAPIKPADILGRKFEKESWVDNEYLF
ncbi:pectin lyase-like protein [Pyrenochaeta sp. DS3sAY3a]|nr:pectin lyase-like protein [Pyrenochaeta sp. DS3sAY3a]